MQSFEVINAKSFDEASKLIATMPQGKADALAGGTDLLNGYKHSILDKHPDQVVNLKNIPESSGIDISEDTVTVKALTLLSDIAESDQVPDALSQAAKSVATPLIRNLGTIGGNICQDVRCWYYRYPHEAGGRMNCARKGGQTCYAIQGDNRYHSIFGGMKAGANACSGNCPAGTDISSYMEKLRQGDWDGAAKVIMQVNPMPMCTSRICPHPCQDGCNQNHYGEPVSIHCVERTLGDYILKNTDKYYQAPVSETGKRVAIIGAGPSGLTAAYYLRQQGNAVMIYDSHEKAGGVLQYGIPMYRLPKDIVDQLVNALCGMGIQFQLNTTIGKDIMIESIVDNYDSVFIGTGAWKQPVLGIRGEELTTFGLDFLVDVNKFLTESINEKVLVCGGGNVAMDVALTAKRMGAKKVRLVCLEKREEMPATAEEVARAEEEGVEITNGWGLKEVITDENGNVSGLKSMRCLSVTDENGRFSPSYDENDIQMFSAESIILATGQRVDLSFLGENYGNQLKTSRGLMDINTDTYQTTNEKIFAGGDAATGPNIAIRAIAAGRIAAYNMGKQLGTTMEVAHEETGFLTFDTEGIKAKEGAKHTERSIAERTLTDEDSFSLTMKEAEQEARRCMNCGCYSVNASDISPVLMALNADIETTDRKVSAADFFTLKLKTCDVLKKGELVTAIQIPSMQGYNTGYEKSRIRTSIDFAIVSLAWAYKLENGKIADITLVAGGVAPVPVRLSNVEKALLGQEPTEKTAQQAGELSLTGTMAMEKNSYKKNGLSTMVSRLVQSMG